MRNTVSNNLSSLESGSTIALNRLPSLALPLLALLLLIELLMAEVVLPAPASAALTSSNAAALQKRANNDDGLEDEEGVAGNAALAVADGVSVMENASVMRDRNDENNPGRGWVGDMKENKPLPAPGLVLVPREAASMLRRREDALRLGTHTAQLE